MKQEPRRWEQHPRWLVVAGLLALAMVAFILLGTGGILAGLDPAGLGHNWRGYTVAGILLGILALLLSLAVLFYSARKRSYQEQMPGRLSRWHSTMRAWLWAHVYLGLLALLAATLHAGYALRTAGTSSGKWAYYLLALLALSGLAWRLVYRWLPGRAANLVRNYAREDSEKGAARREVEMEKIAAGRPAALQAAKTALLAGKPVPAGAVPAAEAGALAELERLAAGRNRALKRARRQQQLHLVLQGWRWLHIPLALLFVLLLIWHIIAVTDLPARLFPAQLGAIPPAGECAACHQAIVEQWSASMHAHAVTSPVTIVQTNQVAADTLAGQPAPDPALLCNNCHAPLGAWLTEEATLPLPGRGQVAAETMNEGVTCLVCHQNIAPPASGQGGQSDFWAGFRPGRAYYGSIVDPAGNRNHEGRPLETFQQSETLCQNCHNVNFDLNDDGQIVAGADLILQTTYTEFEAYRAAGGAQTCVTCHMPLLAGNRVAEAADIPADQDYAAPDRPVRDHSFVGVDYPLDSVAESDPQRAAREALLRSAARFRLDPDAVQLAGNRLLFDVEITNNNLGHDLPTGFAFARQMWVEITVRDENNNLLFSSGLLPNQVADLCDAETVAEPSNPMRAFVVGCPAGDPQLVNFQQKLLDDVNNNGVETWLQHLTGGAVARTRPADGQLLTRIPSGESRRFSYAAQLPGNTLATLTITARLLFRNLPPSFLRALAANQPAGETPQLAPLIPNLQIVEMATDQLVIVNDP